MAVSDGMILLGLSWFSILLFLIMWRKEYLWNLCGYFGLIAVSLGAVMVQDTALAWIFFLVNLGISGINMFEIMTEMFDIHKRY